MFYKIRLLIVVVVRNYSLCFTAFDYEGEDEGGVIDVTSAGSADRHREGPDGERVRHAGNRHNADQSAKSDDKGIISRGANI